MARVVLSVSEWGWEGAMLDLRVEKIGDLAVVECEGRIVRSEAAFQLRKAERGFAAHDSAYALNDRQVTYFLNAKVQHGSLPAPLAHREHDSCHQTQPVFCA